MIPDTFEEAGVGRWQLDPAHSTAEFRVPNFWGLMKVKGRSSPGVMGPPPATGSG